MSTKAGEVHFQALVQCTASRSVYLVAPVDAAALKALLTPGQGLRLRSVAAVLWLDDLEPFLNGGVTWQTLCEWRASGSARIVAGTYWRQGQCADRGFAGEWADNYRV